MASPLDSAPEVSRENVAGSRAGPRAGPLARASANELATQVLAPLSCLADGSCRFANTGLLAGSTIERRTYRSRLAHDVHSFLSTMQRRSSRRFITALVDDATTSSFLSSLLRLKEARAAEDAAARAGNAPSALIPDQPRHDRAA